jgi:hypothetical protein
MSRNTFRLLLLAVGIVAAASVLSSIPVGWDTTAGVLLLLVGGVLALVGVLAVLRKPAHRAETFGGAAFVALLFGGLALYLAWDPWREYATSSQEPQSITLQDLLRNGYGDNRHVWITDFVFCDRYFQADDPLNEELSKTRWIWIPVVPDEAGGIARLGAAAPTPRKVQILLRKTDTGHRNPWLDAEPQPRMAEAANRHLRQRLEAEGWRGRVRNGLQTLTDEENRRLRELAPDTDVDAVLLIDTGPVPRAAEVFGLLGAGAGWIVFGLALAVVLLVGRPEPTLVEPSPPGDPGEP